MVRDFILGTGMSDRRWCAALLIALAAFQAVVFFAQLSAQITPFYPRAFDQAAYLSRTYDLVFRFYQEGFSALVRDIFTTGAATTATHPAQGALLALIGGPNRTAVISLNLVYFLALQLTIFSTLTKRISRDFAWFGVALVIGASTVFQVAGGILDFRIDFIAQSLFGIWICAVLQTDGWRNTKWSVIAGLCAALLVSTRFITVTYIIAIGGTMLLAFGFMALKTRDLSRFLNLVLSGSILTVLTAPLLWTSRKSLFNYYGIGHLLGPEKEIRAGEVGVYTPLDHLTYYPSSVAFSHLGTWFFVLSAVILLFALASRINGRQANAGPSAFEIAFLALCIIVPLGILTTNISKSPVTGGIMVTPIVILVVTLASMLGRGPLPAWLVACPVVVALLVFVNNANKNQHALSRADLQTVDRMNSAAIDYISVNKLTRPKIAVDRIEEFFYAGAIKILYQERDLRRRPISPVHSLWSIFATTRDDALQGLAAADVAFLSEKEGRHNKYPFHASMREYWDQMNQYAETNMSLLATGTVRGVEFRVYGKNPKPP